MQAPGRHSGFRRGVLGRSRQADLGTPSDAFLQASTQPINHYRHALIRTAVNHPVANQFPASDHTYCVSLYVRSNNRHNTTMALNSADKLRALYRAFLREMPARPVLSKARAPLHLRLREHFKPTNPSEQAIAQAEQYLAYVRAQRTYVTLLERYNPGMGMDEEERVRLTARRVGMDLPAEYGTKKE